MEVMLIAVVIGLLPAAIAQSKGRSFVLWWIYGAALFIVALPHSLIMSTNNRAMEQRALHDGSQRKCPNCAELIKAEARVCRYCGRDVVTTANQGSLRKD